MTRPSRSYPHSARHHDDLVRASATRPALPPARVLSRPGRNLAVVEPSSRSVFSCRGATFSLAARSRHVLSDAPQVERISHTPIPQISEEVGSFSRRLLHVGPLRFAQANEHGRLARCGQISAEVAQILLENGQR